MASTHWTAADLPDMSGKTVVVTGASSGLGVVTAREFARVGAHVVLAVRNVSKGESVAGTIAGDTEVRPLDLASLASVRSFAEAWTGDIHVLVNNAGIMQVPEAKTADGFELQIGTNHLGHFGLTNLLLPHITHRIVNVSSGLHQFGRIDLDDLNWEKRTYNASRAYRDSKEANVLFTRELQRRLDASTSSVRVVTAVPGVVRTNLFNHLGALQRNVYTLMSQTAEHGARPSLFAATQDIPGNSFVAPDGLAHVRGYPEITKASAASQQPELARRLWDISALLTARD